jgi:hypothetical protein
MVALQPGMKLLLDQQQAYREEQQVRAHTQQINTERWVAQHHNELADEQAALDAQKIELHQHKAMLGTKRAATIDYTKA